MTGFGQDIIPGRQPSRVPSGLRVLNGPASGRVFSLAGDPLIVGRSDPPAGTVDIDLTECELGQTPVVSRRHCELRRAAGRLTVVALLDRNGTYVNGSRLLHAVTDQPSAPVELAVGDRLLLANVELEVVADEP